MLPPRSPNPFLTSSSGAMARKGFTPELVEMAVGLRRNHFSHQRQPRFPGPWLSPGCPFPCPCVSLCPVPV